MTLLYWLTIALVLLKSINGAPRCCMFCCGGGSETSNPTASGTAGSLPFIKPGPNIRPTVYPPSTVEYCDDPEEDNQRQLPDLGAIGGARSPFSGRGRPHVGKRPGGGGRRPRPGKGGKGKGKPPKPAGGGGTGPTAWEKAGTVFDGVNAGVGVGRLTMDAANLLQGGGDYEYADEEGGEGVEESF